jgi:glycine/D-amino acid oxidase-like deaminating enzyme
MAFLDVDIAPMTRILPMFDRAGIPYETWDAATLAARIPGLDPGRYWPPRRIDDEAFWADGDGEIGGLWCPAGGYVDDPQLAAVNLADAARRAGATFVFRRRVVEVLRDGGWSRGVQLDDGVTIEAPVVVNVGGPWSSAVNALAGVGDDFTVAVRPMRQEVHQVAAPPGYNRAGDASGPVVADVDLGTYLRPTAGHGLLVRGTAPDCDPKQWIDDPDAADPHPSASVFTAQVTRAARRFPELTVPATPRGVAGVYDVASDWTPIYDRTSLDGYYVAMGTSGNQFKNAPAVGRLMAVLVDAVERGHDHDNDPLRFVGAHTGLSIDVGAFSRRRPVNTASTGTVLG